MPKSWVTLGTGTLIRDFLREKKQSYPKEVYAHLKEKVEALGYQMPTYQSVRKFMYVLAQLGLIRFERAEPIAGYSTAYKRRYYALTQGREKDPAWLNPYAALYYPTKFKQMQKFPKPKPKEWMEKIRRLR